MTSQLVSSDAGAVFMGHLCSVPHLVGSPTVAIVSLNDKRGVGPETDVVPVVTGR